MEIQKLNNAAEEYNRSLGKSHDVTWNDGEYGFIAGARWHETLPLNDKLTEEEIANIRKFYSESVELMNFYKEADIFGDMKNDISYYQGRLDALKFIFGVELFTD